MKKESYDTLIIGPISLDIMIDCHGEETRLVGGACVQSGYAASNAGARTAVFTKASPEVDVYGAFSDCRPTFTGRRPQRRLRSATATLQRTRRQGSAHSCPAATRSASGIFPL